MVVTTVFFDFDGTLAWSRASAPGGAAVIWRDGLRSLGLGDPGPALEAALGETDRELGGRLYGYLGRTEEFWALHDGRVLDRLGLGDRSAELLPGLEVAFEAAARPTLFPDSRPALEELARLGYRLGIISNNVDTLARRLDGLGIAPFFGTVTVSQEARAEKPAPGPFRLALERAGCRPDEAVHVGDSVLADVEGARRSGLVPVWLRRGPGPSLTGCPTIRSLAELALAIAPWGIADAPRAAQS